MTYRLVLTRARNEQVEEVRGTAHFACTFGELADAHLPEMSRRRVRPWRDHGDEIAADFDGDWSYERDRLHRVAYGRTLADRLDLLEEMGLLVWRGVKDNMGAWWRTEIRLLDPDVEPSEQDCSLGAAALPPVSASATPEPEPVEDLQLELDDVAPAPAAVDARLAAMEAPTAAADARARARARALVGGVEEPMVPLSNLLSASPYGAPPTEALPPNPIRPETTWRSPLNRARERATPPTADVPGGVRGTLSSHASEGPTALTAGTESGGSKSGSSPCNDLDARLAASVARAEARAAAVAAGAPLTDAELRFERQTAAELRAQERSDAARDRCLAQLRVWPAGRKVPKGVARGAFESAMQCEISLFGAAHEARLHRAIARYERYVEGRPIGWPTSGGAALALVLESAPHRNTWCSLAAPVMLLDRISIEVRALAKLARYADVAAPRARRARRNWPELDPSPPEHEGLKFTFRNVRRDGRYFRGDRAHEPGPGLGWSTRREHRRAKALIDQDHPLLWDGVGCVVRTLIERGSIETTSPTGGYTPWPLYRLPDGVVEADLYPARPEDRERLADWPANLPTRRPNAERAEQARAEREAARAEAVDRDAWKPTGDLNAEIQGRLRYGRRR
jgi:hypothetical protein